MHMCTDCIQNIVNKDIHEIDNVRMCTRDSKSNPHTTLCNVTDSLKNKI